MALLTGKFLIKGMRLLGRNATTLPGKIILRIAPKTPEYLSFGQSVTLITGTNGKTTTARLLYSIYEKAGYNVISNISGANLMSGITTTLLENLSLKDVKRAHNKEANNLIKIIIEIDEGAFGKFSDKLNPEIIAVTNLFRDQLDRYGELSKTRELIIEGINRAQIAKVILCADDFLVSTMFPENEKNIVYFGIEDAPSKKELDEKTTFETSNCINCGAKYHYKQRTYAHLGIYECPSCGLARPNPQVEFSYLHTGNNLYKCAINNKDKHLKINIPIPGEHNVYNAVTAITIALFSKIDLNAIKSGIENANAGFGRMEKFEVDGKDVCIVLVKNPAGLDRALSFLSQATDAGGVLFLLNDKIADGTDVSWIWDVGFEQFSIPTPCHVSGSRGYDMALRLKYSSILPEDIIVNLNISESFNHALKTCKLGSCLYIFPNYTSMLTLRSYLEKKYKLRGIWE